MEPAVSLCFLLTAGEGRRLRPFTERLNKPSLPLLNTPLVSFGYYLAKKAGFKNFLLNKHHLPEQVDRIASWMKTHNSSVNLSDETEQLLGSGGAIWKARKELSQYDYFLVANGDEVLIPQDSTVLRDLLQNCQADNALCTLLTCDHPELLKTLKPAWINSAGNVQGFGKEPPSVNLKPVHYTGYKVFSSRVLDWLPEGESHIFYEVFAKAIAQGERVSTYHLDQCHWYETGNFHSFLNASEAVIKHHWDYLQELRGFLSLPDLKVINNGHKSYIVCPSQWEEPQGLLATGTIVIHPESQVDENVTLVNSILCAGAHAKERSSHTNTFVF